MKIALAQMDAVADDLAANLDKHLDFIQQAVEDGADLIVFPELSLTGDEIGPSAPDASLVIESEALLKLGEASHDIDLVIGLSERSEKNLYNRFNAAFYFHDGEIIHRHRKLFLVNYTVFDEAKHYVPGFNLQSFDTTFGRVCMLVCNDVWHAPSPYLAALDGAEMIIIPSNSARGTLQDHLDIPTTWEHMNRAYSGMLSFYTVFVNRAGVRRSLYGDFPYWGGSEIIGPRGEVIVKAPYDEETLVYGEVELELVAEQRFKAPIIRDARLLVFHQEFERLTEKRTEELGEHEEIIPLHPDDDGQAAN